MAVPWIVEKAFRVNQEVQRQAKRTYRRDVGRLYPIVPFVERDVPTGIYVWVGLVGPLSDRVLEWNQAPSRFAPPLTNEERSKIEAIELFVLDAFAKEGFILQGVGFENRTRIDAQGFYAFR